MKKIIIILTILLTIVSCTKKEEVLKKDDNQIKIDINNQSRIIANNKEIILEADILYLPKDEIIVEHGFRLSTNTYLYDTASFKKYVINEKPSIGKIAYKLPDISFAEYKQPYAYFYYIITQTHNYTTKRVFFELSKL